ncbi:pilus assembly protein [Phenylobacterium sp. LjRoot225]|uniref:TadE/TadG family type IV pilus assembly protein n=1 Tax=Phenylobacterium sp. LjRoot225 TaxID=3342285 RepID=UPI003ECCACD1
MAKDESGGSAIEFALLSPLLILVVVGTIQVGWILHCAASVRWALEASARTLLFDPNQTADQLRSAMLTKLSGLADARELAVTLTRDSAARTVVVQTRYDAPLSLPLVSMDKLTFQTSVTVPTFDEAGVAPQ